MWELGKSPTYPRPPRLGQHQSGYPEKSNKEEDNNMLLSENKKDQLSKLRLTELERERDVLAQYILTHIYDLDKEYVKYEMEVLKYINEVLLPKKRLDIATHIHKMGNNEEV